jgi:biotin transport system ATP-binding protein
LKTEAPASRPAIILGARNLTRVFGDFSVLRGIDLDLYEGECAVIAGANGSGKTVLSRILAGLIAPSSGGVFFRGRPLEETPWLRRAVGLVFQDPDAQFVGETVAEDLAFGPRNLGVPPEQTAARVKEALEKTGLESKADWAPRRLSGGEKRRLALGGVLAMGCEIIFMDEPFANLDWPSVRRVLEIISRLKAAGATQVILTHELEKVLAHADRLFVLDNGVIAEDGNCEAVLDRLKTGYGVRDPRRSVKSAADCTWL